MFLKNFLKNLDFNDKQIALYFALTRLKGFSPVTLIAYEANLNRTTVYGILEDFVNQKICVAKTKNGVKQFSLDGSVIKNLKIFIENKKSNLNICEKKLEKAIPELSKFVPSISFYEGVEEIKAMYEDILKQKNDILSFFGIKDINQSIYKFLSKDFIEKRKLNKIKAKIILMESSNNFVLNDFDEKRVIPNNIFSFEGEIILYGHKIMFCSFNNNELIGSIIQSESFSKMLRSIFTLSWQTANEYDFAISNIVENFQQKHL